MMALKKGSKVFIRTVTYHYTGEIERVTRSWIILKECTWIAESGRFSEALEKGTIAESEQMLGTVYVSRATIVDIAEWRHALPVPTQ